VKNTLLVISFLALCNLTLIGQTGTGARIVQTTEKSAVHVPPPEPDAALKNIYSNLGSSPTDLYYDVAGLVIMGPFFGNGTGFGAMQFAPKQNSHVSQVRVAVQYGGVGANQVNLSIYGDSNGVPGKLLAGPVTVQNLPNTGTCCALAVASFTPLSVIGGTKYWVVADTPLIGQGSDFSGFWALVIQRTVPPYSYSFGGAWFQYPSLGVPAGQVLGTIP
jgi:hypothetical protein